MLKPIAHGLWGFEQEVRVPGGIRLPSRTAIVRLEGGGLLVHSPLAFDDEAAKRIDELGEVQAIVAPSCIHYFFLEAAAKRWPTARLLGAPGLEKKLPRLVRLPGVALEPLPRDGTIPGLGDELAVRRIDGAPYMTEHVFLHRPTRSLVVTDLVFNVSRCRFGTQLFLRFVGAYKKTAQSRMWRLLTKDRAAAAESAHDVLAWDIDRVVVAHGDVVEEDAPARLRAALAKMVSAGPPPKLLAA